MQYIKDELIFENIPFIEEVNELSKFFIFNTVKDSQF